MRPMRWLVIGLIGCAASSVGPTAAAQERAADIGQRLLQDSAVKAALDAAKSTEPQLIEEQQAICEVPAPPFHEEKRAQLLRQKFIDLGLTNVRIDKVG